MFINKIEKRRKIVILFNPYIYFEINSCTLGEMKTDAVATSSVYREQQMTFNSTVSTLYVQIVVNSF